MIKCRIFTYFLAIIFFPTIFVAQTVDFKDGSSNTLLQINDEGNSGSITLPPLSSITNSSGKLYRIGNTLFWDGSAVSPASSAVGWTDNGTKIYTSTRRVGIGTTNPLSLFSVGGAGLLESSIYAYNNNPFEYTPYDYYAAYFEGFGYRTIGVYGKSNESIGVLGEAVNSSGVKGFATGGSGIGVNAIAAGGTGIGVKGEANAANAIAVYGTSTSGHAAQFDGKIRIEHNSTGTSPHLLLYEDDDDYARIKFENNTSGSDFNWIIAAKNSATNADERLNIYNSTTGNIITATGDGNVGIGIINPGYKLHVNGDAGKPGGGNWSVASDKRLKSEIKIFEEGLDLISKINPISFKYNGKCGYPTDKKYIGVIAQEIQKIAPYMISEKKMSDGQSYLHFDPSAMDFIAVNAINELSEKQSELERENLELKKQNTELLNRLVKIEQMLISNRIKTVSK
jgi:hypothetical protein